MPLEPKRPKHRSLHSKPSLVRLDSNILQAYIQICTAEVHRDSGGQKEQLAQLQLVLTNLDKERDSLQEEVDQKADKINDLEKILSKQVH